MAEFGYAGQILKINLSDQSFMTEPSQKYTAGLIGGRGFAARLFWDMVPPQAPALAPENCLIFTTGPTTSFVGIAGCRWQICAKSPLQSPEVFSYGNLGGKWGPLLKAAGFDVVTVQGKSAKPLYIFIHDGQVEFRDASDLWGTDAFDTIDQVRAKCGGDSSVVTIGPGGENQVVFATALSDEGASGGGGMGAVMGSKNLKAIAVSGTGVIKAADPARLQKIAERIKYLKGSPDPKRPSPWGVPGVTFTEDCYGCSVGCSRQMYIAEKDRKYKSFCQQTSIYRKAASDYYQGQWNEVQLRALRLCDGNTLDSSVMAPMVGWLIDCYKEGVVSEKESGLPLAKAGGPEFIEALVACVARRQGFGEALAKGLNYAAATLGPRAEEILARWISTRSAEARDYDPRLFITTALLYATEPRRPINQLHGVSIPIMIWSNWRRQVPGARFNTEDVIEAGRRWWGGAEAADFSTYNGKARAAKIIQDRCSAKDSLILCDLCWPIMAANSPGDHVGDPALESQIYSAITGRETDEAGLLKLGERIYNLQRAIQIRQGWQGRRDDIVLDYYHTRPLADGEVFINPDALMPGPGGTIISRVGSVLEKDKFEELKNEYYRLRGWDVQSGYPTVARLRELGLDDVAADLKSRKLAV
ncbi:MAG TPA: aldehyde ferredoxin oxidoreductase N-terminal domain-containing protein [Dehalococcoidales bacterium]|nr:aldehyde ferredoxin oxidoreductase N-terminal domain-containing protein [Dehalococcoidales bacterium]